MKENKLSKKKKRIEELGGPLTSTQIDSAETAVENGGRSGRLSLEERLFQRQLEEAIKLSAVSVDNSGLGAEDTTVAVGLLEETSSTTTKEPSSKWVGDVSSDEERRLVEEFDLKKKARLPVGAPKDEMRKRKRPIESEDEDFTVAVSEERDTVITISKRETKKKAAPILLSDDEETYDEDEDFSVEDDEDDEFWEPKKAKAKSKKNPTEKKKATSSKSKVNKSPVKKPEECKMAGALVNDPQGRITKNEFEEEIFNPLTKKPEANSPKLSHKKLSTVSQSPVNKLKAKSSNYSPIPPDKKILKSPVNKTKAENSESPDKKIPMISNSPVYETEAENSKSLDKKILTISNSPVYETEAENSKSPDKKISTISNSSVNKTEADNSNYNLKSPSKKISTMPKSPVKKLQEESSISSNKERENIPANSPGDKSKAVPVNKKLTTKAGSKGTVKKVLEPASQSLKQVSPKRPSPAGGIRAIPKWTPPARINGSSSSSSSSAANRISPTIGLRVGLSRNYRPSKPLHTNVKLTP